MTAIKSVLALLFVSFLGSAAQAQQRVPVAESDLTTPVRAKHNTERVLAVIRELKRPIKRAAQAFGIDPLHVAGAIAGEHAMNVNIVDSVQNMRVDAYRDARVWASDVAANPDRDLSRLVQGENYQRCRGEQREYDRWYCIVDTWNRQSLGSILMGKRQFFIRFTSHFFNPNQYMALGMTFGIGQMSPVRALMVDDLVARAGRDPIDFWNRGDLSRLYAKILEPESVVYYVAATVYYAMAIYRSGGYDISENPGVVATLYNLGNEKILLRTTRRENRLPETNDLGKWVNQNRQAIQEALR